MSFHDSLQLSLKGGFHRRQHVEGYGLIMGNLVKLKF